jgi:hypothetical protein
MRLEEEIAAAAEAARVSGYEAIVPSERALCVVHDRGNTIVSWVDVDDDLEVSVEGVGTELYVAVRAAAVELQSVAGVLRERLKAVEAAERRLSGAADELEQGRGGD